MSDKKPDDIKRIKRKVFMALHWIDLFKKTPDGVEQTLSIDYKNGYPRFVIKINDGTDKDYWDRTVSIPLKPIELIMFADMIDDVISKTSRREFLFKNIDYTNKEERKIVLSGVAVIQRINNADKDYVMLSFKEPKKDETFTFRLVMEKEWFEVRGVNGQDISDSTEVNMRFAKAYAHMLRGIATGYLAVYANEQATIVKE
jgi:hypothetical protein